jgi:hypothetical protein
MSSAKAKLMSEMELGMSATQFAPAAESAELAARRARAERHNALADRWMEDNASVVASCPVGTVLIINVATGGHITGSSATEAKVAFRAKFGTDASGWLHRIGHPLFIGGGLG